MDHLLLWFVVASLICGSCLPQAQVSDCVQLDSGCRETRWSLQLIWTVSVSESNSTTFFFLPLLIPPPPTPPQNDYCNKCTADVCKLNQVEEEVSFHLSGQRERKRETCLGLCLVVLLSLRSLPAL